MRRESLFNSPGLKATSLDLKEKLRIMLADSIKAQTWVGFRSTHRLARNYTGVINLKLEIFFSRKLRVASGVQENRNPISSRLSQG